MKKESILQLTWRLFAICIAAALLLGATYVVTKEPIAEQDKIKKENAQKVVLCGAESFEQIGLEGFRSDGWQPEYDAVTEVNRAIAGKEVIGYCIGITAKGYNPGIRMTVGIGADGVLKGISITEQSETPGLGANAQQEFFTGRFKDKPIGEPLSVVKGTPKSDNEIEAITSATITSKGVVDAVNTAVRFYQQYLEGEGV